MSGEFIFGGRNLTQPTTGEEGVSLFLLHTSSLSLVPAIKNYSYDIVEKTICCWAYKNIV